jgi:hypothetical protein
MLLNNPTRKEIIRKNMIQMKKRKMILLFPMMTKTIMKMKAKIIMMMKKTMILNSQKETIWIMD